MGIKKVLQLVMIMKEMQKTITMVGSMVYNLELLMDVDWVMKKDRSMENEMVFHLVLPMVIQMDSSLE